MNKTILLLFGGTGAEHSVSCATAYSILRALGRMERRVLPVGITRDGGFYLYRGDPARIRDGSFAEDRDFLTPTFPVRLGERRGILVRGELCPVDVAIPALHGDGGEDGTVQGLLDTVGIPYVGADTKCGALTSDKALTKILAEHLGIPTVPWCSFGREVSFPDALFTARAVCGGNYPYFIKPTSLGSSIGASVVRCDTDFREGLAEAAAYGDVLIEKYITDLRELEVAYLRTEGRDVFSPIGEVRSGNGFYDYREKYESATATVGVAEDLSPEICERLYRYAAAIAKLTGCRDLARIDFFLDRSGNLYFNEINPFPGFTDISLYPILMEKAGFDYNCLLSALIEAAYARRIR